MKDALIAFFAMVGILGALHMAQQVGKTRAYRECIIAADYPARAEFCKEILK